MTKIIKSFQTEDSSDSIADFFRPRPSPWPASSPC